MIAGFVRKEPLALINGTRDETWDLCRDGIIVAEDVRERVGKGRSGLNGGKSHLKGKERTNQGLSIRFV